jgi:uncharacterized delta-60 repeat protein
MSRRRLSGAASDALESRVLLSASPAVEAALPPPQQDSGFTNIDVDFYTEAMASQSDGKLLLAGHRTAGGVSQAVIQRFNVDGTPDTTFGTNGLVESAVGTDDQFTDLAITSDDRILASGRIGGDFLIARYTPNGAPDTSFGTNGRTTTSFDDVGGGADVAYAIAVGPSDTVVLGGGSNGAFAFARYTSAGALDGSFGTGGRQRFQIGTVNDVISDIAVQSDNRIVVAGAGGSQGELVLVTRLLPNGQPDLSFAGGNVVYPVPGLAARTDLGFTDNTEGLAVQADNKILIANRTPNGDFGIVRLTSDGAVDPTFGNSGLATADFGGDDDADVLTIQGGAQNQIIAVGTTGGTTGASLAIAAFNPDGTPVSDYGEAGKVVQDTGLPAPRSFRSGELRRVALATVQTRNRRLVAGASDVTDTTSRSAFSRVLVPGSATETSIGTFGTVAGQKKPATFGSGGLKVTLKGGGTGQVFQDQSNPGQLRVALTGTTAKSVLGVKGKGAAARLAVNNVSTDGPLAKIVARNLDVSGTLFVNGPVTSLSLGNVKGTAGSPATVAVAGAVGTFSALSLDNARVLVGANLGADQLPGGGDDTFAQAEIGSVKVGGPITASFLGAGVNPVNGIFGDSDVVAVGGGASRIGLITSKGAVDATSAFAAGAFGKVKKLGKEKVNPATDPRFHLLHA